MHMTCPSVTAPVSVLTLARGRATHLHNVVLGLTRQTRQPDELVIGVMQDAPYDDLPDTTFPIRQIMIDGTDLPLARARNAVAAEATGEMLIFLDVDCIPAPRLVDDYARQMAEAPGLFMGEVMYLPAGAADADWDYDTFHQIAVRHSDRQGPPEEARRACEDYRCFWSLNFAMSRTAWDASGGFDERFTGYGGEDTDFGRTLSEMGIPIWWIRGARVFHQYHDHCMPPIHHVASVIRNSELFATKWGHRTMEHWLHAFRMMGLIENCRTGLRILREPDADDFALCRQGRDMPYAATGRVIRILEDRARAQEGLPPSDAPMAARLAVMEKDQDDLLAPTATANTVAAE
ncbi:Glycosyltransferase, GT2 family [Loktanella fryxellensis]|uniref:Glycosyltransferase, GT2 family n=2 Tax=Loktanella fryxellensis TaxID=245187 RepID=A0A1H8H8B7_9RHOB|nr:Glycosyltransferase, GT2 family [Loktanella fryxellensis]